MLHETKDSFELVVPPSLHSANVDVAQLECIHSIFEKRVESSPDSVALLFEDEQVSYSQLNARANQLAHHLLSLGVGPEVLVGISMERSPEMLVGLLGILKAGGAFVPLDPTYPQERLDFLLDDAQISLLVTQQALCEKFSARQLHSIALDADWSSFALYPATNPMRPVYPENLVYVIYTSGSTGAPKGVEIQHRGVCNLFRAQTAAFDIHVDDRVLQFASLSFDAAVSEICMALLSGAALVLANRDALLPGLPLIETLQRHAVTTVTLPPSALAVLPGAPLPALKTIISAGEACSAGIVSRWASGRNFFNAYGPTEVTVCATIARCSDPASAPPLGYPIPNTQVHVLDANLQPVPAGTPGDLYIGGIGLARGYHHRPALTTESFLPHPFSNEPGARLYKTGDIACYRVDGQLEFLGRSDWQIKLRGFRIELGEIEAALRAHPKVDAAVVLLREDIPGEKRLVAYTIAAILPWELRALLKETLPEYMLPEAFVRLDEWPLTPNGKIDRHAMPPSDDESRAVLKRFVAPRTLYEEKLAQIWCDILHLKHVGIHDPFFELGGHSLQATRVAAQVRDIFQVELPLDVLFRLPTIAEIAAYIEQSSNDAQRSPLPTFAPLVRPDDIPLSFSQERVWFLQQLNPSNLAYNAQVVLRFKGKLDIAILEHGLNEIVRRHEIFRTTFPVRNGHPVQVIHEPQPVRVTVRDLRTIPAHERQAAAEQLMYQEFRKPFDISQLPLVRWTLLQLDEQEYAFLHVEHHLVHDGWSFSVLLHELRALYAAFSTGNASPLPELPLQFADFALWQRQWMQGEEAEAQLAYWKEKLAGCPELLALPTDRPRPAVQRFQGSLVRVELPPPLCDELRSFCLEESKTLYMIMLSAFLVLLYRYSRQDDLCIGAGIANRRWRETETLIGMIINTVVLRTDLSGNPTFRELFERVQEVTLGAYVHQDLPFGKVVEGVRPGRSLSYSPIYQVTFSFHDSPVPDLHLGDVEIELIEGLTNGSAKFDMNVIIIPQAERRLGMQAEGAEKNIVINWEYDKDLFDEQTIRRMIGHYQELLQQMLADPDQSIDEVPLLTQDERQQLLLAWNATTTTYPREQCIHQLFEQQVESTPDAVAVLFNDQSLTYVELNTRANQLAHYLRSKGVGPDVLVGVYMERSIEMIVALLGILKADGAYVPLDLSYPRERLAFMLKDARVALLVTQQGLVERLPQQEDSPEDAANPYPCPVVCLDTEWEVITRQAQHPGHLDGDEVEARFKTFASYPDTGSRATAENLAYVIYTSGSTGKPKGVAVPHRAVNRLVFNTTYIQLDPSDRVAQVSNVSFDAATFEIWGALLHGAELIGITKDVALSPQVFAWQLREHCISTLFLTTALFNQLVGEIPDIFHSVRHLLFGGEAVDPKWVRVALKHGPPAQLLHMYGPTETTTFASWYLVQEVPEEATTIPIGRPIANTQLYVLDDNLQPVPVDVAGELYIGGGGLARGYLNRPDLTAERFVPHPFSTRPGERLYRTGDIVRWRPDGYIEFLGRQDTQVKIRGFRVELGEIETVLSQHPAVRECAVVVREDLPGNKRLVAYAVLNSEQALSTSELQGFLKQKLPEYMVPSTFVLLTALPLTANGKLDRYALPQPESVGTELVDALDMPRSSIEEMLASIWAEVLGLPRVGIHDDFFALGGHSLLVTQVITRIRETFQVDLSVRSLFEAPTIAELELLMVQKYAELVDDETLAQVLAELTRSGEEDEQSRTPSIEPLQSHGREA